MKRRELIKSLLAIPAVPLAGKLAPTEETWVLNPEYETAPCEILISKPFQIWTATNIDGAPRWQYIGQGKATGIGSSAGELVCASDNRFGKSEMSRKMIEQMMS